MILFHGSPQIINEPRILLPKRTLDYGEGFYTEAALEYLTFIEAKEVRP